MAEKCSIKHLVIPINFQEDLKKKKRKILQNGNVRPVVPNEIRELATDIIVGGPPKTQLIFHMFKNYENKKKFKY